MSKSIIKTVYIVLESWCNETNNGVREILFRTLFNDISPARALIAREAEKILAEGLGEDFRKFEGEVLCNDASEGCLVRENGRLVLKEDMLTFWYGKKGSPSWGQDRWRKFEIEEVSIDASGFLGTSGGSEGKAWCFTETEACDPSYSHLELFADPVNARMRLRQVYYETVIEGDLDSFEVADINDDHTVAFCRIKNGNEIHWAVKEVAVPVLAKRWDIVHEQDSLNPAFKGCYTGVLSDGVNYLFYRADATDGIMEVFGSIEEMCQDMEPLCVYEWTAENDSLLLEILNAHLFSDVYRYGTCDQSLSVLKNVDFSSSSRYLARRLLRLQARNGVGGRVYFDRSSYDGDADIPRVMGLEVTEAWIESGDKLSLKVSVIEGDDTRVFEYAFPDSGEPEGDEDVRRILSEMLNEAGFGD